MTGTFNSNSICANVVGMAVKWGKQRLFHEGSEIERRVPEYFDGLRGVNMTDAVIGPFVGIL